jgi:DNA polymerase-1
MTLAIIYDFQTSKSKILHKIIPDEERDILAIYLKENGIDPKSIYFTFAYPVETSKIDKRMGDLARTKLLADLKEHGITKALICGTYAYQIMLGSYGYYNIANFWGQAFEVEGIYCVLAPSPAEILKIHVSTTKKRTQPNTDRIRDFDICMEKLVKHDHVLPIPTYDYSIVETVDHLGRLLKGFDENQPVVADTETTGLNALTDTLMCLGLGQYYPGKTIHDPVCGHMIVIPSQILYQPETIDLLRNFFSGTTYKGRFVYHNAKFDLKFLQIYLGNIEFNPDSIDDTILMSYMLDERPIGWQSKSSHGLKSQSRIWFDAENYAFDFESFYATPEQERDYNSLYYYLSLDLVYTLGLQQLLTAKMDEEPELWCPYRTLLIPATVALAEIEIHGAKVNIDYLKNLQVEYQKKIAERFADLQSMVDDSSFNPNSPKKVKECIEKLSEGILIPESTDKASLTDFVENCEVKPVVDFCQKMLEYRETGKTLSTYINSLIEKADKDGYIHADFNLNGTGTGRTSCSNPNLQNIPFNQGPVIRRSFCATEGKSFVTADFSQLELRVAAWVSQDENFLSVFKSGRDVHREVASKVYQIPYDEVTPLQRKHGKTFMFGVLYGRSAWAISNELEISQEEAEGLIHSLLDGFPKFNEWVERTKEQVRKHQFVSSLMGRKRRWPLLTDINKSAALREGVNSPIQSFASDICLTSLISLHNKLKKLNSCITFTVHDSIEFEIDNKYLDETLVLIRDEMVGSFSNDAITFEVEIEVGSNWADAQKVK